MARRSSRLAMRPLVALIVCVTVVPLAALVWLGWRLLDQDRLLETQQMQQRVERAADLVVAALQREVSAAEQRLVAGEVDTAEGAVAAVFEPDAPRLIPPSGRVAFLPAVPPLRGPPAGVFARADELELRRRDYAGAIVALRALAQSSNDAIRAEASLRLARTLGKSGRAEEALAHYRALEGIDEVGIGGAPASLAAAYARCRVLEEQGQSSALRDEARALLRRLRSGRWMLATPVYWLYATDAARWAREDPPGSHPAETLALALAAAWEGRGPAVGTAAAIARPGWIDVAGDSFTVVWQSTEGTPRVLIASPQFVESQWLAATAPLAREHRVRVSLRTAAATSAVSEGTASPSATRSAADSGLPWTLSITGVDPPGSDREFARRRRLLAGGFALLVGMALIAGYVMVRAVNRELSVARLQSDFVSAVSHEFRTPLTTMRQFTQMLIDNRAATDERRLVCYEAQARATDRLTRLVESLLDFGRMEAGAWRYTIGRCDASELVRDVSQSFGAEARAGGYDIAFTGTESAPIRADHEALSRAVLNLLENAVKYSPGHRAVDVGVSRVNGTVHIAVRDRGMGIPAHEQRTIFAKFQRGDEARTLGIRGTGIGLAMADEIVRAHRGRIDLDSEPGRGSTFTIVLPADEAGPV